jgi:hypothetical protein
MDLGVAAMRTSGRCACRLRAPGLVGLVGDHHLQSLTALKLRQDNRVHRRIQLIEARTGKLPSNLERAM